MLSAKTAVPRWAKLITYQRFYPYGILCRRVCTVPYRTISLLVYVSPFHVSPFQSDLEVLIFSSCCATKTVHQTMTAPMQKQIEAPTVDRTIGDPSSQKTVLFRSPATTPPHDPGNLPLRITQAQKQALIDNLQLEGLHIDD